LDDRALLAGARTIFVARCELLGDGVAVVVREDVDAVDAELGEELLVKRRLVHDRVGVAARLVRPAEADHVRRHDAEAGDELGPHGVPVPRRARETMDREERRPLALGAVEDGMSLVLERSSLLPPPLEIFAHGGTILLGLGTTLSSKHRRSEMNPSDFPAPKEGFVITHFLVVSDQDRSREFYRSLLDGKVLVERDPVIMEVA